MIQYAKADNIPIRTNIERKPNLALDSICRDCVVEDILHSGKYHIDRIGVLVNPFKHAPTTALLLFSSEEPVQVNIQVVSGDGKNQYKDTAALNKYHRISITALTKGKNVVELIFNDQQGNMLDRRSFFIWLADLFPDMENPIC